MRSRNGVFVICVTGLLALTGVLAAPVDAQATGDPAATAAPPPVPTRPLRQSWTSDARVLREGDIVTIVVDEFTLAESDRNETATRRRRRNTGARMGMATPMLEYGVDSQNDVAERRGGETARRDRFQAEISVRVVEATSLGLVRVEGVRKLQIDGHMQDVTVRGWLRTNDVRPGNIVESWRVADAEILYGSTQSVGEPTESIWDKLFKWIVP